MAEPLQRERGVASVFDAYADYYDLLYRDKDYLGESNYVASLIRRHRPAASSILEFGCGTGAHARCLSGFGFKVTGIDRSAPMIARARSANAPLSGEYAPEFIVSDLRSFRAGHSFDVVLALFHVVSYQTSNEDLQRTFLSASAHLEPGGLMVFDCWYGPAVLTDPPTVRVKRICEPGLEVLRIAEPEHDTTWNRVDVNVEVHVSRDSGIRVLRETHAMRYLFVPELAIIANHAGLSLTHFEEWLTGGPLSPRSWYACMVCEK